MNDFRHPSLPGTLQWRNQPRGWRLDEPGRLTITAGGMTDLFHDPSGAARIDNSPCAFFTPPDPEFLLSARVDVGFASTFDAGVLVLRGSDEVWA
jgi:hypothetical protein